MARKLKVFVVPAGFHDAYVAAPSRKAALEAWGSEHDLFARGIAQEVTDPALVAEPLAHPGEVIKRSRGTTAEQIAALPPDVERPTVQDPDNARPRTAAAGEAKSKPVAKVAKVAPVKVVPKPSRDTLSAAEEALETAQSKHREEAADLAGRFAALERERRTLNAEHQRGEDALAAKVDEARGRYDRAMKQWRAS